MNLEVHFRYKSLLSIGLVILLFSSASICQSNTSAGTPAVLADDPCVRNPPLLVVTPATSASVSAGALVQYDVSITDQDPPDCSSYSYLLYAGKPSADWSAVFVTSYFQLNPGENATTELQVMSPPTQAAGSWPVLVSALGWPNYLLINSVTVQYQIGPVPSPDFFLTVNPNNISVSLGSSGNLTVTSNIIDGFNSNVALSVSGLPGGVTSTFTPATIPGGAGTATLKLDVPASATANVYQITITGTAGALTHSVPALLTITPAPSFTISVLPKDQNIGTGATLQYQAIATYSDTTTKDVTNQVTWYSDTPSVASISTTGLATGIGNGRTNIQASLNGVMGQTTLTVGTTPTGGYTLLGNATPPAQDLTYAGGVEVGLKFYSDVAGNITAIRFYKTPNNGGTHVGELWSISGQLLASATFMNETPSGWQTVYLGSPVAIQPYTGYVVSYHSTGHISYVDFTNSIDSPPLHAPVSSLGANGVYRLGDVGTFPGQGGGQNYLVDVILNTGGGGGTPTLTGLDVTPKNPTIQTNATRQFTAMASYSDSSTKDVTTQATWASGTPSVATIIPSGASAGLATGVYNGSTQGTTDISASFGGLIAHTTLTVTANPPPPSGNITLFGNVLPSYQDLVYAGGVEVGLKFYSDIAGSVTAIRFFKSPNNWGTHVGELWTITGQLLASVTFTNETGSGWQQMTLPNPIPIDAGTAYIVAYHSQGPVSYSDFLTSVDNPPLHAPVAALGGNGVYKLGAVGTFPILGAGKNYLVDLVFVH